MFAISATAFRSLAARGWAPFGWRFGSSVEDRIAKISMRDGESAMVGNFDCDHIGAAVPRPGPIKRNDNQRPTKNDGATAVNREFNFSKAKVWVRALRDGDVIVENANVCSQRNSVSQSCSARLGVIRLAIRKIGRGSDCEDIDARWRKRDGREFRLGFSRPAPFGGPLARV